MNALLGMFYFRQVKALYEAWFIKLLSVPVNSTRINISDVSQIGGANGYAEER